MAAALEPSRWLESLDQMARHVGAAHGQLIGMGGERNLSFNLVTNVDDWPNRVMSDGENYSRENNFRIAANLNAIERGKYDPMLSEDDYDAVIPSLTSSDYLDLCAEFDVPYGCQTNLVLDGIGLVGLATLRKRGEGRTTQDQLRIFAEAAGAARRAVRLQERLEGQQAKLLAGAFDALAMTAFVIDARGQLLAHSLAAEALLTAGSVHLRDGVPEAAAMPYSLSRAIAALTRDDGPRHVQLRIEPRNGLPPVFLEGFRLPPRPWSFGRLPHAILLTKQTRRDRAGVVGFLTAVYGLTPAEADIAIRLYEGKSRGEIAADRDVTVETLRGQIKSLYAKMAADGEAALVRALAAVMA